MFVKLLPCIRYEALFTMAAVAPLREGRNEPPSRAPPRLRSRTKQ
jgi:hypothetical protein